MATQILATTEDGKRLASYAAPGVIEIRNAGSAFAVQEIRFADEGEPVSTTFSLDGSYLSVAKDGLVKVFDLNKRTRRDADEKIVPDGCPAAEMKFSGEIIFAGFTQTRSDDTYLVVHMEKAGRLFERMFNITFVLAAERNRRELLDRHD